MAVHSHRPLVQERFNAAAEVLANVELVVADPGLVLVGAEFVVVEPSEVVIKSDEILVR